MSLLLLLWLYIFILLLLALKEKSVANGSAEYSFIGRNKDKEDQETCCFFLVVLCLLVAGVSTSNDFLGSTII